MNDLDLIDWHRVARAVIAADYGTKHDGYRCEPSEAAKEIAQDCIDEYQDGKRLRAAGFQSIGGFWCRIEDDKIATYLRESAIHRLTKEETPSVDGNAKISSH